MNDLSKLKVSSSPHIRAANTIHQIMLDVLIALTPALVIGIFVYGLRALTVTLCSVAGCVFFEWIYEVISHKPITIKDLSAAVTGVLLAFCLPVSSPLWMVLIGDLFAIVVVKQLFGGIGKNFVNPALSARAFLLASFAGIVSVIPRIRTALPLFTTPVDVVTTSTPLVQMKQGALPSQLNLGRHIVQAIVRIAAAQDASSAQLQQLLWAMLASHSGQPVAMDAVLSHEIARVVDAMRKNQYRDSFSLAEMASISRMPVETFRKRFVSEVGMPPQSYQLFCKMERAKTLLRGGMSVRQTGVEIGMPDPYHFSKQFKHIVGMSPTAYLKHVGPMEPDGRA